MKRDVVAGLIFENEKFMICQRPENKARGLLWEFVGGKVESNESNESALIRECREELGVEVKPIKLFMKVSHNYPDISIDLYLYTTKIIKGEPRLIEHNDIRWITVDDIDNYEFCPADKEILDKIKEVYSKKCR